MTSVRAIAETTPTRTHLRLVVIAQWIAAGLALIRGATTSGRGLVGGAVALWRLAQAVRLAILLARRLREAADAPRAAAPGAASTPVPAWSLEDAPLDDDALRRALAELEAAIADALAAAPQDRASVWDRFWDRERPARIVARASQAARSPRPRPYGRRTPPLGLRPLRPPGPERPCRRRWRTPGALKPTPPPIADLATGRDPLARRDNTHIVIPDERLQSAKIRDDDGDACFTRLRLSKQRFRQKSCQAQSGAGRPGQAS